MSTLTATQIVARDAFKHAILDGVDAGYPDSVRIVCGDENLTLERMSDLLEDSNHLGVPVIIVRRDGAEMLLEVRQRRGPLGALDRLLHRVRVVVSTRGDAEHADEQYVHPDRMADLRGLRLRLAI